MLIAVVLLLFRLEDKRELYEEFKSQWSGLRGFNWQHFMSYIMLYLTELSCHTTTFAIFYYVNKCQSGAYSPTLFSSGGKDIVSPPIKYEGIFF